MQIFGFLCQSLISIEQNQNTYNNMMFSNTFTNIEPISCEHYILYIYYLLENQWDPIWVAPSAW